MACYFMQISLYSSFFSTAGFIWNKTNGYALSFIHRQTFYSLNLNVFCIFNLFTSHSFCHLCRHDSHHLWLDLVQLNLHFAEDLINSGLVGLVDLEQKHCSVLGLIGIVKMILGMIIWGSAPMITNGQYRRLGLLHLDIIRPDGETFGIS